MFKQYWRNYPWWLQLVLFVFMIFIFISLAQATAFVLLPKLAGVSLTDLADINAKSGLPVIKGAIIWQVISVIGLFLIPTLVFANLAHPRPAKYLGMVKPGKPVQLLLAVIAMVAATPVFLGIASLIHLIDLGVAANATQAKNDELVKVFMDMSHQIGFVPILLVMALLPAISEELFFRGILMRFSRKRSNSMVLPVALSSMAFALAHNTPYTFLSIFFAGVLLALIYQLTGSIWPGMLAHMCYNGSQLALDFFGRDNAFIKPIVESDTVPVSFVFIGGIISAAAFYLLWQVRTPLPPRWADDFTQQELSEKAV